MEDLTAMEALKDGIVEEQEEEELTPTGRKKRGKNKWKRGELKAYREEKKRKKLNAARIEAITEQMHELTLKIWQYTANGKRGCPEHLGLREQLHVLHAERKELGYDAQTVFITEEDRAAAKRYKAEKKKERELKKLARSGGQKIMRRKSSADKEEEGDE